MPDLPRIRRSRARAQNADASAEPLRQIDRTYVIHRGRKLIYFAGCDYFRLASHPDVLRAVQEGLGEHGLNVAASRKTTGNHPLYQELEAELARFFAAESALAVSTGYITNSAVLQALAGEFQHALIDERAHASLLDAAAHLGVPITTFEHRNPDAAKRAAAYVTKRAGKRPKILLLTDGLFSHSGEAAPLDDYLQQLPDSVSLLVDDAHGAGTLGRSGRGTAEHLGLKPQPRLLQTVTLSKAFGVYGGAILGPESLRQKIISRSRIFAGSTPLPLPLVAGVRAAVRILRGSSGLRRRLVSNAGFVKAAIREAGIRVNEGPGPIIPVHPRSAREATTLSNALLAAGVHPPFIQYPGGPKDGYFRFAISSEHTAGQLDALVSAFSAVRRIAG